MISEGSPFLESDRGFVQFCPLVPEKKFKYIFLHYFLTRYFFLVPKQ